MTSDIKKRQPLVSVIMNCYNGEKYLNPAIESVLNQTYQNWEIIFWDNLSADLSAEIFNGYKDPRFKYFLAEIHTPLYEARNQAIRRASGELIAFLDVDDIWVADKLRLQIPLFEDPSVGFSCGKYILLNQRRSRYSEEDLYENQTLPSGKVTNELLSDYFIHVSTLIVRKSCLDGLDGPCDPRFNIIGDLDLAIKLSKISELAVIQNPVAYYRWHESNTGIQKAFSFCDEFDKWFSERDSDEALRGLSGYLKLKEKNSWSKCIKKLYIGKRVDALKLASKIRFKNQIKLMIALLLPTYIFKKIINR